jgi:hypothetical protein
MCEQKLLAISPGGENGDYQITQLQKQACMKMLLVYRNRTKRLMEGSQDLMQCSCVAHLQRDALI